MMGSRTGENRPLNEMIDLEAYDVVTGDTFRELEARCVRAEEALREALQYAREWPIGLDTDTQEQRGGPRDTLIRNIESVLAVVPEENQ